MGHAIDTSLYAWTPHPCGSRAQVPYLSSGSFSTMLFKLIYMSYNLIRSNEQDAAKVCHPQQGHAAAAAGDPGVL